MPETDLALLTGAALQAGEIARRYFGQSARRWDKADNAGPVTEADLAVNDHLEATLRAARPDYGWLSEETEDSAARLATRRQFIVDPIDGTRAFIDGSRDWAHSLALAEDGRIVAAAVYLPMRDALYAAALGRGATLNGAPIRTTLACDPALATVLTTRPTMEPAQWKGGTPPPFKRHFRSSLAFRLCLVAEGRFDAMLTLRAAWEWDIAAGALIVSEAGGRASDKHGAPLRFNNPHPQTPGVVAAGTALHTSLQSRLV